MNWVLRFGNWLENRARLTKPALACEIYPRIDAIEAKLKEPPRNEKEVALLRLRLDRLELYTGLKREPVAITLPGEARIS